MGRVYAVASGKGGVGKTTTVANLGTIIAAGGHDTVVVDADLGMGNLADTLGIDPADGPTVHDVLAGTASVAETAREGPGGLVVIPGSADLDAFGDADPENLGSLVDGIDADVVLLDTSAGLSHDSVEPLRVADEVLLVSTTERAAIVDTHKTGEVADRLGTPVAGAVLTRVGPDSDVDRAADALDVPIRGSIPEDDAVAAAAETGESLAASAPDAPATRAYCRLAADLTGDASLEPPEHEEEAPAATDEPAATADADATDEGATEADAAEATDSADEPEEPHAEEDEPEEPHAEEDESEESHAEEDEPEESDTEEDAGEDAEDEEDEAGEEAMASGTAAAAADPRRTPGEDDSVADRVHPTPDLPADEGSEGAGDEPGAAPESDEESEPEASEKSGGFLSRLVPW